MLDEHRQDNNADEEEVVQPPDPGFLMEFLHGAGRPDFPEAERIDRIKQEQQKSDRNGPDGPGVFEHPEERDAAQVSEEEGRIADRRKRSADIADKEDKENDVEGTEAESVRSKVRPDHNNRSTGRSQNAGGKRAKREHHGVRKGCREAP